MAPPHPLLAIQTPQLVGICCGVAVFVSTIITVAVLFVKGGSIDRLRAEAKGEKPAPPRPKLVDELLEAVGAASVPRWSPKEVLSGLDDATVLTVFKRRAGGSGGCPLHVDRGLLTLVYSEEEGGMQDVSAARCEAGNPGAAAALGSGDSAGWTRERRRCTPVAEARER